MEALRDKQFIAQTKQRMDLERQFLIQGLLNLGFKVFPSVANNLLCQIPARISTKKFRQFLTKEQIGVMLGSSFGEFSDQLFRIAPRLRAKNKQFLTAMKELVIS